MRLESARQAFRSDAQVAEALGVDRAQVKRWREGETEPGPGNADRVVGLEAAVTLLSGYLEPSSIPKWLMGQNAQLGERRPVDLLREGNLSAVIAAIEALRFDAPEPLALSHGAVRDAMRMLGMTAGRRRRTDPPT